MPRWLLPVFLVLLTASSAALALRVPAPAEEGEEAHGPPLRVPVLSARRAPGVVSRVVADTRLRANLQVILAGPLLGAGRDQSCLTVRQGARPIFERGADRSLIPASTLKVLTGQAVLSRMGEDERLVTEVRAAQPLAPGGVVGGPLWLVGGGDPLLATADFAASAPDQPPVYTAFEPLADALVASGVRHVVGGVIGDETRYDVQRYVPTWKPAYAASGQVGPASALSLNDGFAQVGPRRLASPQPDGVAATVLTNLLRARGVVVAGAPAEGVAPAGAAVVARVSSPPMREVVGQMLRDSDNLTAELLVKELGHRFGGEGSTRAGVAVVRETLAGAGLPVADLVAVDGSGLDRGDRASCSLLMAALEAGGPSGALASGFPVAARTGTLARRFAGNPAAGRLRAKTGTLDNVTGLTGYIAVPGGDDLAFALLVNGPTSDAAGRALQEQLGAVLARYPDAPPPTGLGP
ncbi:MAG: D-alanyl-D-alanine carboxypeptidase/D-alanyl-D-alanine-endopeptidase [Actinomycetota bacterium]|nr:D-alanyl-D-alanine carboxypeptidase/D-alanyl-D-alanine-endopeptidase [Actinomycetota bacterium]